MSMKYTTENISNTYRVLQLCHRFPIFVVAGILSVGTALTLLGTAFAVPVALQFDLSEKGKEESIAQTYGDRDRLPCELIEAIRQDLSRQTGIAPEKLKVIEASRETWPDGCLGLAKPDQFCTQLLVEGWRVLVSDGSQTWVYRTDKEGRTIRLESEN